MFLAYLFREEGETRYLVPCFSNQSLYDICEAKLRIYISELFVDLLLCFLSTSSITFVDLDTWKIWEPLGVLDLHLFQWVCVFHIIDSFEWYPMSLLLHEGVPPSWFGAWCRVDIFMQICGDAQTSPLWDLWRRWSFIWFGSFFGNAHLSNG
jgi:hypothetical protein